MAALLKPKTVTVTSLDGEEKDFIISRLPATVGREIVAQYPLAALPKIGDYAVNEAMALKMMAYVAVAGVEPELRLTTKVLVDNHATDWEMLFQLERAMLAYNTSFFGKEGLSTFFGTIGETFKQYLMKTLTDLLAASSKLKPPA